MYVFHPLLYRLIMGLMRSHLSLAQFRPAAFMAIEFLVLVTAVCLVGWTIWQLFKNHEIPF